MAMVSPPAAGQSARPMAHPNPMAARRPPRPERKRVRLNHDALSFREKFLTQVFLGRACLFLSEIAVLLGSKRRGQNRASLGSASLVGSPDDLEGATAGPNENGKTCQSSQRSARRGTARYRRKAI